jgi:hypothetical protein
MCYAFVEANFILLKRGQCLLTLGDILTRQLLLPPVGPPEFFRFATEKALILSLKVWVCSFFNVG